MGGIVEHARPSPPPIALRIQVRRLALLLAERISRREDAVIYRAGFSNEAGSLALRLWDKSNNLAHIRSKPWLKKY
ncbi:MAG: hypothetical protein WBF73_24675 [Bradyrhizobium sp.]